MTPPDAAAGAIATATEPSPLITRFDRVQRSVHWINALLMLFLIVTGFSLYGAPGFRAIGYRGVLKEWHLWVGYALPVPLLALALPRAGAQLRRDLRRVARWTDDDTRWWRRSTRTHARVGKFNPGQKLNTVFVGACIIVFIATGSVMRWSNVFPLSARTGADYTHRWFAVALLIVTAGHIAMALSRPQAMRAMLRGTVKARWARHEHPRWYAEVETHRVSTSASNGHDLVDAIAVIGSEPSSTAS